MDLRDMFTTWQRNPEGTFRLNLPLDRVGCPCNQLPRAMSKLRKRIIERMEAEGHELTFNPRYEMTQDGVGIRCRLCAMLVRGFISTITAGSVTVDFVSPEIEKCRGPL